MNDALRDKIVGALNIEGAFCGTCDREPGSSLYCKTCVLVLNGYADAVLAVLDTASEWEYGAALESNPEDAAAFPDAETAMRHNAGWNEAMRRMDRQGLKNSGPSIIVRRRKAGAWEPAPEGEEQ